MKIPAKLVIVPSWMIDKVKSSSESNSILTDVTRMSNIFTVEDVAFYISINEKFITDGEWWCRPLLSDIKNSFNVYSVYNMSRDVFSHRSNNNPSEQEDYLERVKARSDAQILCNEYWHKELTGHVMLNVISRLPNDSANVYVYELIELNENVFGLIIRPLSANVDLINDPAASELYSSTGKRNSLLETISKFYPINIIAQTDLYKGYVLSKIEPN